MKVQEEHFDSVQTQIYFRRFIQARKMNVGDEFQPHEFTIWITSQHHTFIQSEQGNKWVNRQGISGLKAYIDDFLDWLDSQLDCDSQQLVLDI